MDQNTMSKDGFIPIYLEAQRKFTGGAIVCALFCMVEGFIYRQPILAFISNAILLTSFLSVRYLIDNWSIKNGLLPPILMLWSLLVIILSNGTTEFKFIYFSLSFTLIIFQDFRTVIVTQVIAFFIVIYGFIAVYFQLFGYDLIERHFLNKADATLELFMATIVAMIIQTSLIVRLTNNLRSKTLNNIKHVLLQKSQLKTLEKNKNFAKEISSGNYETNLDLEGSDEISLALDEMRKNLLVASKKDQEETFEIKGITQINEILNQQFEGLADMADEILKCIVNYLDLNQGGVFIVEGDKEEKHLELIACYAYSKKKYISKNIQLGQGAIGQAYLEKSPIYLTEIPTEYLTITSGLGEATPTFLSALPLVNTNEEVVGALELASFRILESFEQRFLERAIESITATVVSVQVNEKTKELLKESNELAQQLKIEENKLNKNMVQLKEAQKKMHYKQKELEISQTKNRAYFEGAINGIIGCNIKGKIESINSAALTILGKQKEHIMGENIDDLFNINVFEFIGNTFKTTHTNSIGEIKHIDCYCTKIETKNVKTFILYIRDISVEVAQKQEIKSQLKMLEHANEEVENVRKLESEKAQKQIEEQRKMIEKIVNNSKQLQMELIQKIDEKDLIIKSLEKKLANK